MKMQIDSQAVRHLDLLEVPRGLSTVEEGSLLSLIDST
jgi:hypothetical protein